MSSSDHLTQLWGVSTLLNAKYKCLVYYLTNHDTLYASESHKTYRNQGSIGPIWETRKIEKGTRGVLKCNCKG
jgi:hypothetical protein